MVEHVAQAALPLGHVVQVALEKVKPTADLCRDLGRGEHGHPGGGEQDAQGHALHHVTDAEHVGQGLGGQLKVRLRPARALQEQPDGAILRLTPGRREAGGEGRNVHPLDGEAMLAPHVQPGPRGNEDHDLWRHPQDL